MTFIQKLPVLAVGILLSKLAWSACIDGSTPIPEFCTRFHEGDAQCALKSGSKDAIAIQCKSFKNECASYTFEETPFSFSKYRPATDTTHGVKLPRNGSEWTLYRGMRGTSQITLQKTLTGIFGDPMPTVGSVQHFRITKVLTGRESLQDEASYLKKFGTYDDVEKVKACLPKMSDRAAAFFAADILDKSMKRFAEKKNFADYFMRYRSPEFNQEYGNTGEMLVYSGLHSAIAKVYGSRVLSFSDTADRGFDANYWNFKDAGEWAIGTADVGEYLMPGYVDSRDIKGLVFTNSGDELYSLGSYYGIGYGIQRFTYEGKNYALLFEGQGQDCVILNSQNQVVPCTDQFRWPDSYLHLMCIRDPKQAVFIPPSAAPSSQPLPIVAIIGSCPVGESCELPKTLSGIQFAPSTYIEPKAILDEITSTRFHKGSEFYRATYFDLKGRSGGIDIVSAHYVSKDGKTNVFNEVTPYAANFCNGKKECNYGTAYLPETAPGKEKTFAVSWKCSGSPTVQTLSVADGAVAGLKCQSP